MLSIFLGVNKNILCNLKETYHYFYSSIMDVFVTCANIRTQITADEGIAR